ncbi:MAG TPA: PaaI family thioesterase [Stellaceae bacterium]|nr:PaaI family thioesterase [Stellaceae bacterium]
MPEPIRDNDTAKPRIRTVSWGDPAVGVEVARSLNGVEFVRKIMRGEVPAPPVFNLLGFRLVKVELGEVNGELEPAEFHYNPMGGVHGGVVSTVLDSVMGLAVLSRLPLGSRFSSLEIKINFVRGITAETGTLLAEGKIVHPGAKISTSEARLVDRQGKLYAHGSSTCIVIRDLT